MSNKLYLVLWDDGGWCLQADGGGFLAHGPQTDLGPACHAAKCYIPDDDGAAFTRCRTPDGRIFEVEPYEGAWVGIG